MAKRQMPHIHERPVRGHAVGRRKVIYYSLIFIRKNQDTISLL